MLWEPKKSIAHIHKNGNLSVSKKRVPQVVVNGLHRMHISVQLQKKMSQENFS